MIEAVSKYNPLSEYIWGNNCKGWNLVSEITFSVKQEFMPPGTAEEFHFHKQSGQFFFILNGEATFEINEKIIEINKGQGLYIKAGERHRILNKSTIDLDFLLCSCPSTENDRINCLTYNNV